MIALVLKGDRVRLEVNIDAAKEANLSFTSDLLRLAKLVKTDLGAKPR